MPATFGSSDLVLWKVAMHSAVSASVVGNVMYWCRLSYKTFTTSSTASMAVDFPTLKTGAMDFRGLVCTNRLPKPFLVEYSFTWMYCVSRYADSRCSIVHQKLLFKLWHAAWSNDQESGNHYNEFQTTNVVTVVNTNILINDFFFFEFVDTGRQQQEPTFAFAGCCAKCTNRYADSRCSIAHQKLLFELWLAALSNHCESGNHINEIQTMNVVAVVNTNILINDFFFFKFVDAGRQRQEPTLPFNRRCAKCKSDKLWCIKEIEKRLKKYPQ